MTLSGADLYYQFYGILYVKPISEFWVISGRLMDFINK